VPHAREHIRPRRGRPGTHAPAARPPRLEPSAELELVVAAKQPGSDARAELIETFTPLVASVARIYRGSSVSRAELMQEGAVGLLRALGRYDVGMGTPFWAYASWWVRQAMQQLVSELTRPVVLSDRAVRQLARVKDARRDLLQAHSAEPSIGQLAERTGLERVQVENLLAADWMPRPLEEPIGGDDGGSTFGDQLADPRAEDAYDRVPRRLAAQGLRPVIGGLTDREKTILAGRFGFQGPEQTLRELGDSLGVSAERVRQIESRALDKLRSAAGHGLTLPTSCPTYAEGKVDGRERPSKTTKGTVMTTLMEPVAPWLRDLNRLFTSEGNQFLPTSSSRATS
jgi:RNA polymerase primary sigma factor